MLQVRKKLFLLPLFLMVSQLSFAQESSELLYSESLKALDSLVVNSFRSASNSTDFLIIRKESYAYLKGIVSTIESDIRNSIVQDSILRVNFSLAIDSLNSEVSNLNEQLDSSSERIVEKGSSSFYLIYSVASSIFLIFFLIKLISQRNYIDGLQEAFIEMENTFQAHKRKSIEKERKIKRELIDSNLKLEELENQLKLLNHSD